MSNHLVKSIVQRIAQQEEGWNTYLLEDGTVVKVKLVVKKISRVMGQTMPTGEPVFNIEGDMVSTSHAPAPTPVEVYAERESQP